MIQTHIIHSTAQTQNNKQYQRSSTSNGFANSSFSGKDTQKLLLIINLIIRLLAQLSAKKNSTPKETAPQKPGTQLSEPQKKQTTSESSTPHINKENKPDAPVTATKKVTPEPAVPTKKLATASNTDKGIPTRLPKVKLGDPRDNERTQIQPKPAKKSEQSKPPVSIKVSPKQTDNVNTETKLEAKPGKKSTIKSDLPPVTVSDPGRFEKEEKPQQAKIKPSQLILSDKQTDILKNKLHVNSVRVFDEDGDNKLSVGDTIRGSSRGSQGAGVIGEALLKELKESNAGSKPVVTPDNDLKGEPKDKDPVAPKGSVTGGGVSVGENLTKKGIPNDHIVNIRGQGYSVGFLKTQVEAFSKTASDNESKGGGLVAQVSGVHDWGYSGLSADGGAFERYIIDKFPSGQPGLNVKEG